MPSTPKKPIPSHKNQSRATSCGPRTGTPTPLPTSDAIYALFSFGTMPGTFQSVSCSANRRPSPTPPSDPPLHRWLARQNELRHRSSKPETRPDTIDSLADLTHVCCVLASAQSLASESPFASQSRPTHDRILLHPRYCRTLRKTRCRLLTCLR
jgi:hypothetical protein